VRARGSSASSPLHRTSPHLARIPKVLVLFYSHTGNTAAIAEAVAEGAKSVRFTEVDVRRIDDLAPVSVIDANPDWKRSARRSRPGIRHSPDVTALADYDALILDTP
jgi:multimeric flavodoxin WrbA